MKKKLNLLWNLKFNFFSVAERPLTFFAYFHNAKKVGRRRLVIVPATAGGLPLFPHAASVPAPAEATTDRAVSRSEMEPNGDKRRGASAGPHLSKAKMGQRARCPRRGQRPASAVSRSEMEPNGDKRRPAPCGTNVRAAGGARLPGYADGNRREMQE